MKGKIESLGQDLYGVNGKVFLLKKQECDIEDPGVREAVLALSRDLFVAEGCRAGSPDTHVCEMIADGGDGKAPWFMNTVSVMALPVGMQELVRRYRNGFVRKPVWV